MRLRLIRDLDPAIVAGVPATCGHCARGLWGDPDDWADYDGGQYCLDGSRHRPH
jgi:hypothetical protein